jgi:hypothetical protein
VEENASVVSSGRSDSVSPSNPHTFFSDSEKLAYGRFVPRNFKFITYQPIIKNTMKIIFVTG